VKKSIFLYNPVSCTAGRSNATMYCPAAYQQAVALCVCVCVCVFSGIAMSFTEEWTGILGARRSVFLEMCTLSQLVKILPALIETECSSPCSQKTTIG
jgi:TRAP-type C4-dicarboxylate transport system permease small subunit